MPDLNTTAATARNPRGAVRLFNSDGQAEVITGWESFEVDNNAYRAADTFRITFVVASLPTARGVDWFASQTSMMVEILAGLPEDHENVRIENLDSLIYGEVDDVAYNPVRGTIEVSGRDLTAKLIDTKTSEHYANQTASQIVTTIAKKYGLTPIVTKTKGIAGAYYKDDHASTTNMQSEWELLTELANHEDFLLYVKGKELHFEPKPTEAGDHYVITWDAPNDDRGHAVSNAVELSFSRALTIAKGVTVEVRSWNDKSKHAFTESYPKTARGIQPGKSAAKTQVYKYTIAGLTPETAQKRAQALYAQIVRHEMNLTAYLPADQILRCTNTIQVRGTGTAFDQIYYPESVKRTLSITEGYRMNIRAKNKAPELQA